MEKASKVIINLCGTATVYQSLHGPINMGPFLLIPFMWPIGMSLWWMTYWPLIASC